MVPKPDFLPDSRNLLQVNLAASEGGITSEANVTDIHEALNFDQNDSVSAACNVVVCAAVHCCPQLRMASSHTVAGQAVPLSEGREAAPETLASALITSNICMCRGSPVLRYPP